MVSTHRQKKRGTHEVPAPDSAEINDAVLALAASKNVDSTTRRDFLEMTERTRPVGRVNPHPQKTKAQGRSANASIHQIGEPS